MTPFSSLPLGGGRIRGQRGRAQKTAGATCSPRTYVTKHSERATRLRIPIHFMLPSWMHTLGEEGVLSVQRWVSAAGYIPSHLASLPPRRAVHAPIRNTNLLIRSLLPSVLLRKGLRNFSEYRDLCCNLFLEAWPGGKKKKSQTT